VVRHVKDNFGFIVRGATVLAGDGKVGSKTTGSRGALFFLTDQVRRNVALLRGDLVDFAVKPGRGGRKNQKKPMAIDVVLVARRGGLIRDQTPETGDVPWRRPRADSFRRNSVPEAGTMSGPREEEDVDPQLVELAHADAGMPIITPAQL